jgi:hypothetical protein
MSKLAMVFGAICVTTSSCGRGDEDAQRARVEREMKQWLVAKVHDFRAAAEDLQRAAPTPRARG